MLQYCITRPQTQRNRRGANTGAQLRIARLQAPLRGNDEAIIHSPQYHKFIADKMSYQAE